MQVDPSRTYIGIVEDNNDPKKLGRCRVRVVDIFDDIPVGDIPWASPWKDLNGNGFNVPERGKILTVVFDSGNVYKPEYIYAEHYNVNLEKKLETLSNEDYVSMKSVMFDHSTQIYRNGSEGLKIDHEYTNINLDKWGNILFNLRDNKSVMTLGSKDADEEAVLGTTFFNWFDELLNVLSGVEGGPYLAGGVPVIPNVNLSKTILKYRALRPRFLSNHVKISKNRQIIPQRRPYLKQEGDSWKSTKIENELTFVDRNIYQPKSDFYSEWDGKTVDYDPLSNLGDNPAAFSSTDYAESVSFDIPTSSVSGFENGKMPSSNLVKSKWANGEKKSKWVSTNIANTNNAYLTKEAAQAFDALLDLYDKTDFPGKGQLIITDGYRNYDDQVKTYDKYGAGFAAKPGTSNHGWGLAMDVSGIANPFDQIKKNVNDRPAAFRSPIYQWLFANSYKFGIYNPVSLRDGVGVDEYWHWEFNGDIGVPKTQFVEYSKTFTKSDKDALRRNNVTAPTDSNLDTYFKGLS